MLQDATLLSPFFWHSPLLSRIASSGCGDTVCHHHTTVLTWDWLTFSIDMMEVWLGDRWQTYHPFPSLKKGIQHWWRAHEQDVVLERRLLWCMPCGSSHPAWPADCIWPWSSTSEKLSLLRGLFLLQHQPVVTCSAWPKVTQTELLGCGDTHNCRPVRPVLAACWPEVAVLLC